MLAGPDSLHDNFLQSDQYQLPFLLSDRPSADPLPPIELEISPIHTKTWNRKEKGGEREDYD